MTLILFCKRPRPGVGKQRLVPALGPHGAFRVAELLHQCALAQLAEWPHSRIVACADADDCDAYRNAHPWIDRVVAQQDGNLGQRINRIDRTLRAAGHQRQLIIGSDMPEQTSQLIRAASALLDEQDIVLSAATDGGVTLMAARKPWPDLAALPWSTPQLGQALVECCEQAGYSVGWVAPCDDVDTIEDLCRLRASLASDTRAPQRALHTLIQELV
ncbi:TIGR04282 family arsenosugar biosynthesis glycosyltransferase [Marinobacterium rhizophilum]|uniref:DUF2064 domain-containing protein n=1 Tax=Marinobacterium rhizophilum TaxID=420402 RepID=A0ABY5HKR6_9GAMM|nr:DUF2064 domain-containing protein [Marinobacterium rhizophilum]UTW12988.1 DUF2064 domain-containing protein [Marinobacterium rhizophilum]